METFSDGVFAIAATLLVLEISVDTAHTHDLGSALVHLWPSYLAYVTSFITIGIIYNTWWRYASTGRRLIGDNVPEIRVRAISRAFNPGPPIYGLTLLVAVFSPLASVFLTFAIAAFYLPSAALFER